MKNSLILIVLSFLFVSCQQAKQKETQEEIETMEEKTIPTREEVQAYIGNNKVFAHRGSTYWTPEETEASLRWARNIGADYLEFDLQKTKDDHLIVLHDNNLRRTTNVQEIFPERADSATTYFTLKELRQLDIGSWFNTANPERARQSFEGQRLLTLADALMIAEGYWLKKDEKGQPAQEIKNGEWTGHYLYEIDPNDNGNRPGVYAETKTDELEELLAKELIESGWNINHNPKKIKTQEGKVDIANTSGRFILQSFSPKSIEKLEQLIPHVPKCYLLWKPAMANNLDSNYQAAIALALKNNVHFIGPSIGGEPNNYGNLATPEMAEMIHKADLKIHAYTFDTDAQLQEYGHRVDGVFTNRADTALSFLGRGNKSSSEEVLDNLGY